MRGNESAEQVDDLVRQAGELAQRFNNRLVGGVSDLVERYIEGDAELYAWVRVHERYFCAVLKAVLHPENGHAPHVPMAADAGSRRNAADGDELPVFGLVVERVKGIEEVIPSFVRFESHDDGAILWGKSPDLPQCSRIGHSRLALTNGEIDVSWFYGPVFLREGMCQQVETVVLGGNDHSGGDLAGRRERFSHLKFDDVALTLGIRLGNEAVRLTLEKDPELYVEDVGLSVRPL